MDDFFNANGTSVQTVGVGLPIPGTGGGMVTIEVGGGQQPRPQVTPPREAETPWVMSAVIAVAVYALFFKK